MKLLFNPILTERVNKRLRLCYKQTNAKNSTNLSYVKWRRSINDNNDLFDNLYKSMLISEAQLIQQYENLPHKKIVAESDGKSLEGVTFNEVYDMLDGEYRHYQHKNELILKNTRGTSNWRFYRILENGAKIAYFDLTPQIEPTVIEPSENKENHDEKNNCDC